MGETSQNGGKRQGDCCTLPRRIPTLKCVNSEVQFTLNRVPSRGTMAPCRSHHGNHTRQEMDHCSDPLGTESNNVHVDKNQ